MVTPVTLRPRFNPNATAVPSPVPPDVLPPQVDVRQMSLFGAAWTLGSIASLSRELSLRSITYYETTGWRGVMEWSDRPRLPHRFVTRPGWVFPLYFVFALLAGFNEGRRIHFAKPLKRTGMLVRNSGSPEVVRYLVANLDREPGTETLPDRFLPGRWLTLDQSNAVDAMRDPVALLQSGWRPAPMDRAFTLSPYGLAAFEGRLE
jgi:hypothetical protein